MIDLNTVTLAEAAAHYARKRWPVFPCQPGGKAPITPNGFHDATTDVATVEQWWTDTPSANIGCVPARASPGFIVIDVDGEAGRAAATALGLFAHPTLTVTTPRGVHLWFRHPGFHVSNRPLAPGLDVRGDDGYVLLPPSVHPSGDRYRVDKAAVRPLPPGVRLSGNGERHPLPPLPEMIPEGQRNDRLFRLGCALVHYHASPAAIRAALLAENAARCAPPLLEEEVARIVASATRYAPGVA